MSVRATETATNVCDGACGEHVGEVYPVCVDGLVFNYCQEARDEDRRRGFTVDAVEEDCDE